MKERCPCGCGRVRWEHDPDACPFDDLVAVAARRAADERFRLGAAGGLDGGWTDDVEDYGGQAGADGGGLHDFS